MDAWATCFTKAKTSIWPPMHVQECWVCIPPSGFIEEPRCAGRKLPARIRDVASRTITKALLGRLGAYIKARPTTGFMAIATAIELGAKEIFLTGFDATTPDRPNWNTLCGKTDPIKVHNLNNEKRLLMQLLHKGIWCGEAVDVKLVWPGAATMPAALSLPIPTPRTNQNTPVLLMANSGAADITLNCIYSLKMWGIHNIEIYALDQAFHDRAAAYGLSVTSGEFVCASAYQNYGTQHFKAVMQLKLRLIVQQLKAGHNVLYMDGDTVATGDIYEHLVGDHDVWMQTSRRNWGCMGFVCARSTPSAWALFEAASHTKYIKGRSGDEKYVNHVLRNRATYGLTDLKLQLLSTSKYPSGRAFFGRRQAPDPVMVHNNYISGMSKKIQRFTQHGMWYLDEPDFEDVLRAGPELTMEPKPFIVPSGRRGRGTRVRRKRRSRGHGKKQRNSMVRHPSNREWKRQRIQRRRRRGH